MSKQVVLTEDTPYSRLTINQRRYVDARLQGLGPVAAARAAGVSEGSLERHPKVRAAIKWVVKESGTKASDLTKSDVMQGMLDAVDSAETSQELVAAWRELGKLIGAYEPERKILEVRDYSKDELKVLSDAELAQLAGKEMSDVIDGEFQELHEKQTEEETGQTEGHGG